MRVFNPDVKTLEDHPFNATVLSGKYYLAIDQEMSPISLQPIPISFYNNYDKYQGFNTTHSNLMFLIPSIQPFSLQSIFLFSFSSKRECTQFHSMHVSPFQTLKSSADSDCVFGTAAMEKIQFQKEVPTIELKNGEEHIKIVFN